MPTVQHPLSLHTRLERSGVSRKLRYFFESVNAVGEGGQYIPIRVVENVIRYRNRF